MKYRLGKPLLVLLMLSSNIALGSKHSTATGCLKSALLLLNGAEKGQKIVFRATLPGFEQPLNLYMIFDRIEGETLHGEDGSTVPLSLIEPASIQIQPSPPKPKAPPPTAARSVGIPLVREGRVVGFVKPGDGIEIHAEESDLAEGENRQVPNAVSIRRPGEPYDLSYNRTNRNEETLGLAFYPKELTRPKNLQGLVVLDVGTGGGKAVEEWRANGVRAFGLDAALSNRQKALVYNYPSARNRTSSETPLIDLTAQGGQGYYIQADAAHSGLAPNQVDAIYSTYAMFEYDLYRESSRQMLVDILQEWHRILKVGGKIRMSPFSRESGKPIVDALVSMVPGLRVQEFKTVDTGSGTSYVEIIKIH